MFSLIIDLIESHFVYSFEVTEVVFRFDDFYVILIEVPNVLTINYNKPFKYSWLLMLKFII